MNDESGRWRTRCGMGHPIEAPCAIVPGSRTAVSFLDPDVPLQVDGPAAATFRFDPRRLAALSAKEAGPFYLEIYMLMTGQPANRELVSRHGVHVDVQPG